MAAHSFMSLLGKASKIVMDHFAEAEDLYRAVGTPPRGGSGEEIADWHFVFLCGKGTAQIACRDGRFAEPIYDDGFWVGDQLIKPPLDVELEDALRRAREAGFTTRLKQVTLRFPLHPSASEPLYILELEDRDTRVAVGARTGEVKERAMPA